jgi:hypothetical protein
MQTGLLNAETTINTLARKVLDKDRQLAGTNEANELMAHSPSANVTKSRTKASVAEREITSL